MFFQRSFRHFFSQELAGEDRIIDSKTVEAEYAEQVAELARRLGDWRIWG